MEDATTTNARLQRASNATSEDPRQVPHTAGCPSWQMYSPAATEGPSRVALFSPIYFRPGIGIDKVIIDAMGAADA